jgi:uncharacterized membrane protein YkvA (DUF1232 family)
MRLTMKGREAQKRHALSGVGARRPHLPFTADVLRAVPELADTLARRSRRCSRTRRSWRPVPSSSAVLRRTLTRCSTSPRRAPRPPAGACLQILQCTISLLAAGMAYMTTNLDLIPDFLPHKGIVDDAMVMGMVCELARDGLDRYVTWKGMTGARPLDAGEVGRYADAALPVARARPRRALNAAGGRIAPSGAREPPRRRAPPGTGFAMEVHAGGKATVPIGGERVP